MSTQNSKSLQAPNDKALADRMEVRRKTSLHNFPPSMTKQEDLKSSLIETIVAQYTKTGMLPNITTRPEKYMDVSNIPSLEILHQTVRNAQISFQNLPLAIRQLCNHDPSKFAQFVANPENSDILIKYGLMEKRQDDDKKGQDAPANNQGNSNDNGNQRTNSNSGI